LAAGAAALAQCILHHIAITARPWQHNLAAVILTVPDAGKKQAKSILPCSKYQ